MKSLIAGLALFVAGCANLIAPTNPQQTLAYLDGQITAGYLSVIDAFKSQRITQEQGQNVLGYLDKASDTSDAVRPFAQSCVVLQKECDKAAAGIEVVKQILTAVEKSLKAKQ